MKSAADGGGTHLLVVSRRPAIGADQAMPGHLETQLRSHLRQQRHVPTASVPEVEVLADDHRTGVEAPHQHAANEVLGGLLGTLGVELHDDHDVEPGFGEQLESLIEVGEKTWSRIRADHLGGVPIEGDERAQM